MKKNILIITAIILVLLTFLGLLIFKLTSKQKGTENETNEPGVYEPSEEKIQSFENKLRELIDSVNYTNQVFKSDAFDPEASYYNELSEGCHKFNGEDADIIMSALESIYEEPFSKSSYFYKETLEDKEELYVCKPTNCNINDINIDDVTVTDNTSETEKTIDIYGEKYTIKKAEDIWKFAKPVLYKTCQ